MKKITNREIGKWAEDVAAHFLKRKGFEVLARNFNTRFGEIDIIVRENNIEDSIVFVEVRFRGKGSFLLPEETLTTKKQKRIKCTALIYLNKFGMSDMPVRFDVICISEDKWFLPAKVQHIVDAF